MVGNKLARTTSLEGGVTISHKKDVEGFQVITFCGLSLRAIFDEETPWFVARDLGRALGIHDKTIPTRIYENPREFEGWVRVRDVTYPRGNSLNSANLPHSDILLNEQAVYLILGGLSAKRVKDPAAREMVYKFKRLFPEIIKAFRTGELTWNKNRKLAAGMYITMGEAIQRNLITKPKDNWPYINEAMLLNLLVYGRDSFVGNPRDFSTPQQLEMMSILETANTTLIDGGLDRETRTKALARIVERHCYIAALPGRVAGAT